MGRVGWGDGMLFFPHSIPCTDPAPSMNLLVGHEVTFFPHLSFFLFFSFFLSFFFFFLTFGCRAAGRILVSQPGIKPAPPALEAMSLNHWTDKEVPPTLHFKH